MGQKLAAYDAQGNIIGYFDSIDSPVLEGFVTIEITDAQWLQCTSNAGWTVVNGALVEPGPPTAAQILANAQVAQTAIVTTSYQAAVQQSVVFTNKAGVAQTYQADSASQAILMQATQGYTIAGSTPIGFFWKAEDNTRVPFVLTDLQGLYGAMLAQGWAAFQKLQDLKTAIGDASTVAAVQAIAWAN